MHQSYEFVDWASGSRLLVDWLDRTSRAVSRRRRATPRATRVWSAPQA